jgi:hypothetical protein
VSRIDEVTFLRKLQRLLEEGDFVATYKFALLQALADLSVEKDPEADGTLPSPSTNSPKNSSSTTGGRQGRIVMASPCPEHRQGRRPL